MGGKLPFNQIGHFIPGVRLSSDRCPRCGRLLMVDYRSKWCSMQADSNAPIGPFCDYGISDLVPLEPWEDPR